MLNVMINGGKGKMGLAIADIINNNPQLGLQVVSARDMGEAVTGEKIDVIIDFSLPDGAREAFAIAKQKKAAVLVGTTNLSAEFLEQMRTETEIPVFYATNVSIGVYLFGELIVYADKLYRGYERSMQEIHHVHKVDAPSGTAKTLASLIDFPHARITSVRKGEVPGTHTLSLDTPYENITLIHEVKQRTLLAQSAVLVAKWLAVQKPGFHSMADYVSSLK